MMTLPRKALLPAGIGLAAILVLLALASWPRHPVAQPPLPVPNGYDDLMRAAGLAPANCPDGDRASIDEIRVFLKQHGEALPVARAGLSKEWRVPIEYSRDYFRNVPVVKLSQLSQLFALEAILAEKEGRSHDASRTYLDLVRMSAESSRGGLLIHYAASSTLELLGLHQLEDIRGKLSPFDRKEAIRVLREIEAEKEPIAEIIARTDDYMSAKYSLLQRAWNNLYMLFSGINVNGMSRSANASRESRYLLLLVDLAVRVYRDDRGALPSSLQDLIPGYLPAIPQDPFARGPFHYRVEGDRFVLYGAGEDGKDDGGDREKDMLLRPDPPK
jgi:hypothetical protein